MQGIALAGLVLLASGLVAGCIFSPDKGDNKPPPPPPVPVLSTPQAVLNALTITYQNRDSSSYWRLFEPDYQGSSYDTNDSLAGNQAGTFTREQERLHIKGLAESASITSVDLYLPSPWIRTTIIGDLGEEWAHITIKNPQYGLTDGSNSIQAIVNETFEFSFRPVYAPESPTDTLWHIVRWTESP